MFRNEREEGVGVGIVGCERGRGPRPAVGARVVLCSRGAVTTDDVELFDTVGELELLMVEHHLTEEEVRELRAAHWL